MPICCIVAYYMMVHVYFDACVFLVYLIREATTPFPIVMSTCVKARVYAHVMLRHACMDHYNTFVIQCKLFYSTHICGYVLYLHLLYQTNRHVSFTEILYYLRDF